MSLAPAIIAALRLAPHVPPPQTCDMSTSHSLPRLCASSIMVREPLEVRVLLGAAALEPSVVLDTLPVIMLATSLEVRLPGCSPPCGVECGKGRARGDESGKHCY